MGTAKVRYRSKSISSTSLVVRPDQPMKKYCNGWVSCCSNDTDSTKNVVCGSELFHNIHCQTRAVLRRTIDPLRCFLKIRFGCPVNVNELLGIAIH